MFNEANSVENCIGDLSPPLPRHPSPEGEGSGVR